MMRKLAAILVLLLAGCAASAQTRPASVNADALLPKHPLYGTLAQYDRQIAALQATLHTRFSDADSQIDNSIAAVRHDLDHTAAVVAAASPVPLPAFPAMQNPPSSGQTPNIESHIRQTYAQQHTQLQSTAQRDMAQYRATVHAQEQQAYQTFVQSVNARTQRAYDARAQNLREKESALMLELARKNAPERLQIRAKLQTLAIDGSTRSALQSRLHALESHEDAQVAAMRHQDAIVLRAYAAQLRGKGDADIAKMGADLQARMNANIAARERVLAAQTSSSGALTLPPAPARSKAANDMQAQYGLLQQPLPVGNGTFTNARDDLTRRFTALRQANDGDTQHTQSEISSLQHDREAVRKKMISQIMYEASRLAKARGYSAVYTARQAPPGSADITAAVAADLKTLSP